MKKLFILFIFLFSAVSADERILDFHSRITVLDNGDIHVIETIKVNVENYRIRHGIFRDTPTLYYGVFFSQEKFEVNIVNVKLDDEEADYHTENLLNGIRIKIGSKDYYVSKGIHEYQIEYISNQQIKNLNDSNGLYWNVTGNGWDFVIEKASVDIYFPTNEKINILTHDAWTGKQGSKQQHFTAQIFNDHIHFETNKPLSRNEGLTIQTTWPLGLIIQLENKTWLFIKNNLFWLASIIMLLIYPIYFFNTWKKVGIDPPKGAIFPLFTPPSNISPAAMGFIKKKYYDTKAFSVAIMNLAVKHHISIEQISKKKYKLSKKSSDNKEALSNGEKIIFDYLFKNTMSVTIDKTYNSRIKTANNLLKSSLTNEHQDACYKNNLVAWLIGTGIGLIVLFLNWIHFFNFSAYAIPFLLFPIIIIIFSSVGMAVTKRTLSKFFVIIASIGIILLALSLQIEKIYVAYVSVILYIVVLNGIFHYLIQSPTVFGRKLLDKIEGFKMYMSAAEQDRLELMHPPEMTPRLFEKYLPFALALGVENKWSKQFNNAMKIQGNEAQNYQPNWYIGNNYSNFDFANTATAISAGLASSVVAASTPPSSNSSGGFGGGGGFSGGGGGGGGGGGW